MKRRDFLCFLAGATVGWAPVAIPQARDFRRIGVLVGVAEGDAEVQPRLVAFRQVLQDLGWMEGRNVQIDYRFSVADPRGMRTAAADLISLKPDVILAQSTPETKAILELTHTIPIVSAMMADPVGSGLVVSFARPGGIVTGFTSFEEGMGGKWVELLKELAPDVTSIATVLDPIDEVAKAGGQRAVQSAASSLGVDLTLIHDVHIERALEAFAHEAFARKSNSGLIVLPGIYAAAYRYLILALAAKYRWPAIYPFRDYVAAGGLMSYGTDTGDAFRLAASYIDRILRGTKPAELPIQAPTNFRLVINLWAAKALDITIPSSLIARADEVIE